MFKNVIIGIDANQNRADVVKLARELVAPDGTLTLAHVRGGLYVNGRGMSSAFEAEEHERTRALLADASAETGIESTVSTAATSAGRGLHELAERRGADLLVLGSTHHGLVGRVLLADHTREAINGAPCAVAIAPALYGQSKREINDIGVGYDEAQESQHALDVAREIAEMHHAKLSLFEAVALPTYLYYGLGISYGEVADETIKAVIDRLSEIEGVDAHATFGDPAEELATFSASVDLLVIGSRGFGPLGRVVHSSTSTKLSHSSHAPLLIVPRVQQPSPAVTASEDLSTAATI